LIEKRKFDRDARPWHRFYGTGFWQRRRRLQLLHEPFCAMCRKAGYGTPATVVDHIEPHRGDWNKFRLGALQSLCAECHDRAKRIIENRGYNLEIDEDGWPTDPNHPANRKGTFK
jgi:5-methylcytosine-specific restriction enzyme A